MAESRISTLRAIWAPTLVRITFGLVAAVAGYDSFSSQFGFPKLGAVLGMSGNLLPWWGWLLILQAIFVYALFEYIRRIQLPAAPPSDTERSTSGLTIEDVETAISTRIGELKQSAETVSEAMDLADGRMSAVTVEFSKRIEKLDTKVETMGQLTLEATQLQSERNHFFESQTKAVELDLGELRRGFATLEQKIDSQEKGFRESIHALMAREELAELGKVIQSNADELYVPLKNGEQYDAVRWQSWESIHGNWERTVKRWADAARWYGENVRARVLTVEDTEYDSAWSVEDAQFPSADAVRRFKRFRIIQVHWMEVSDEIAGHVVMVARGALSERECHGGQYHQ